MIELNEIPHSWTSTNLGSICKLRNGFAFKSDRYTKEGIPVIRISDIGDGKVDLDYCVKVELDNHYLDYKVRKGDILVAMSGATTGKFGIFKSDQLAFQNQRVGRFEILDESILVNQFLLFLLYGLKHKILEDAYGGAQPNISSGKIEEMEIPLPPLAEQHRIVSKIEELFSELDKGIETLKTAKQQLKVYRQAVLKYTFEAYPFSTTLGDLFDFVGGGTPSKDNSNYWGGNIAWASVKDIKGNYLIKTQDQITELGLQESSANLAEINDVILITRINPGRTIISKIKTAINQDLKIAKSKQNSNPLYIHYLFQSLERECQIKSSGTTVLGITLQNLKEIKAPILSIIDQQKIVQEIESRLSVCDKIEESIEQGLQQAEALRQSILKKAFEGKLVPQNSNDEPASVLLERIRAGRVTDFKEKKKSTTKKVKA